MPGKVTGGWEFIGRAVKIESFRRSRPVTMILKGGRDPLSFA
jgi:hypothetical protein